MANNIKNTHTLMINLLSFPEFNFLDTWHIMNIAISFENNHTLIKKKHYM